MFTQILDHVFTLLSVLLVNSLDKLITITNHIYIIHSIRFNRLTNYTQDMTGTSGEIWFDGVNKELIEAHSGKTNLRDGNDSTLVTKTPLTTLSSTHKRKKQHNHQSRQRDTKQDLIKDRKNVNRPKGCNQSSTSKAIDSIRPNTGITEELAIDCEMVECYHHKSVLARVSIVNLFGHPILDRYVAPPAKVTDYRTRWSGIRRQDLVNAPDFDSVQKEVAELIKNRIVVGHSVKNDFEVLKLNHPADMIRDTSVYFKYLFQGKTPSLKKLSETVLGLNIQKGEHDSVQDAQATMKLYVKERDKWNERVLKGDYDSMVIRTRPTKKQKTKPLKKKIKTFYTMT